METKSSVEMSGRMAERKGHATPVYSIDTTTEDSDMDV